MVEELHGATTSSPERGRRAEGDAGCDDPAGTVRCGVVQTIVTNAAAPNGPLVHSILSHLPRRSILEPAAYGAINGKSFLRGARFQVLAFGYIVGVCKHTPVNTLQKSES
jgi:hypothetical protein